MTPPPRMSAGGQDYEEEGQLRCSGKAEVTSCARQGFSLSIDICSWRPPSRSVKDFGMLWLTPCKGRHRVGIKAALELHASHRQNQLN